MSTSHTSWQGKAEQSNKKERTRVAKKYPGTKKISEGHFSDSDIDADPFRENDPVIDNMGSDRKHSLSQYTKASGLPMAKAKKILKDTDTLQK